ncbi:MAG: hypothetical protein WBL35_08635 [Ornithinibacter sp.]
MSSTIDALTAEPGAGPLLYRYTGAHRDEATCTACAYWPVKAPVGVGRLEEAAARLAKFSGTRRAGPRSCEQRDAGTPPGVPFSPCHGRVPLANAAATGRRPHQTWRSMMSRITMAVAFGAGYVLGARAGRDRYREIKGRARALWNSDTVQDQATKAQGVAKDQAAKVQDAAKDRLPSRLGGKGSDPHSDGEPGRSADHGVATGQSDDSLRSLESVNSSGAAT